MWFLLSSSSSVPPLGTEVAFPSLLPATPVLPFGCSPVWRDPDRKREALDLAEFTRRQPWWRKLFGPESGPSAEKYSAATQLAVGGVTGWCTGLVFRKVGKLAATALGGGFFLLQLASHTGYIRVDWQRLEKDVKKAKAQLKIHRGRQMPTEVGSKAEEFPRTVPSDQQRWWLRPHERGVNQREVPIRGATRLSLPESLERSAPGVGNPRGPCRCRSLPCQSRPGPRCCELGHRRPLRVWWLLPKASLPGPDSAPALAWR
ncbi:FUN14 domain-containing protein 2 isoform X3 [Rattus norvegicus]|uniref:FUN14 domain-containing protein 2 isoform X3 n=1 Tax=Rattus norvegicus TaxID=10116 RepID=UPI0019177FEF|nr:FUN14 domain-containing protein 2 isoform X3 [Rattus norvegicus]